MKRKQSFFVEADESNQIDTIFTALSDEFIKICDRARKAEIKKVGYSNLKCVDWIEY